MRESATNHLLFISNKQACVPKCTSERRHDSGFTLLEILVAVAIFVLLAVLLAGLLQSGIDLWKTGETSGDVTERGQIIMEQIKKDLATVFTEPDKKTVAVYRFDESLPLEKSYTFEPSFYSGFDSQGNQWLYLIRLDDDNFYNFISPTYQTSKQRITYYISGTATSNPQLVRGIIDETTAVNFWQQQQIQGIPSAQISQTFDDILYLGCTCYDSSSLSTTWDSRVAITQTVQTQTYPVVPQKLPHVVQVALDIKSLPLNTPKITLVKDDGTSLKINTSKSLLGAGSYIKIGTEWLLVQKKHQYTLTVSRGARNTTQASYSSGEEVQYGETIENKVYLSTAKND
ncbi:MAG: prepilin-type N-terminal cleavage/methylation domain-containing protein [Planctomycetota bacterium]